MLVRLFFQNRSGIIGAGFVIATFFACAVPDADLKPNIIPGKNGGFGYQIFARDKLIIEQPFIPAISNEKVFDSKEDAIKVAQLVIYKIQIGERPPSISIEDLDSLKIFYK